MYCMVVIKEQLHFMMTSEPVIQEEKMVADTPGIPPGTVKAAPVDSHVSTIGLPDSDASDDDSDNLEASEEELLSDEDADDEKAGEFTWQIVRDEDDPMEESTENFDDASTLSDNTHEESEEEAEGEPITTDEPMAENVIQASPEELHKNLLAAPSELPDSPSIDPHGHPPELVVSSNHLPDLPGAPTSVATTALRFATPSPVKSQVATLRKPGVRCETVFVKTPFPSPLRGIPPMVPTVFSQTLKTLPAQQPVPDITREPAHFPPKTIRRVMTFLTGRQDIRVSHPAVDAVAIAVECFVRTFTQEAFQHAQKKKRNVVRYDDLVHVGNHYGNLYFLQDFLPEQEATGYVVRKVLEESGVQFPGEKAEESAGSSVNPEPSEKPLENGPPVEKPESEPFGESPLVASALALAKRWDEGSKHQNWRTMNRHTGKGKNK